MDNLKRFKNNNLDWRNRNGDLVRIPEISLGSYRFQNVDASMSRQTKGVFADPNQAGNLGGEILHRFTLILDYGGSKLYLIPNSRFDAPFIGNRSGLVVDFMTGTNKILSVLPGSPAADMGIKTDEIVIAIDKIPMSRIQPIEASGLIRHATGKQLILRLRNASGVERDVTLNLREVY